jgi:putative ABC transport system ATP-binding protein
MARMSTVLEATDLYRFFHAGDDETLALRGVSLHLDAGEIVAVTGPSGSGKSTLLACLAGLDDPDGGTVRIEDQVMSRRPEAERTRLRAQRLGVLFQSANLVEHLRVIDNVLLVQRLSGRVDRDAGEELLRSFGLGDRTRAYPSELSGGEISRASLAVALTNDPAVVLADEPTGELDAANAERIAGLLRERARGGVAVLVVTHNPAVAANADRTIALLDGQVVTQ